MFVEVVTFWMFLTALFLGLGVVSSCVLRFPSRVSMFSPWMGWAVWIIVLQVWHLFLPVDWRALVSLSVCGGIGLIVGRKEIINALSAKQWLVWGPITLLCAFWLAGHTVNQVINSDSGLYHLNSVRWAKEFAIVPGLGNLHERLAFNQSYFLYAAMLDIGCFNHKSHQLVSGLLILWTLLRSVRAFSLLLSRNEVVAPHNIFDSLMVAPTIYYVVYSGNASSPTPDAGVFFLGILVASELLIFLSSNVVKRDEGDNILCRVVPLVLVSILGIAVKLSFAVTALAVITILLYEGFRKTGRLGRVQLCVAALLCMIVVLLPWMIRGIILSGYPAFPGSMGAFPVDWRVAIEMAHESTEGVRVWAWTRAQCIPVECLGTARGLWLNFMYMGRHDQATVIVPLALAMTGGLCGAWMRMKWKMEAMVEFKSLYFVVPLMALVYWLIMAPDPRFAGAAFWMLAGGAVTWALVCFERKNAAICAIFISVLLFAHEIVFPEFVRPWQRDAGRAKTVELVEKITDSGLRVYMAKAEDGRPWDSPLPTVDSRCWHPGLKLRVPGDMARGFKVDPR